MKKKTMTGTETMNDAAASRCHGWGYQPFTPPVVMPEMRYRCEM
jgi:hypothetical protein